MTALNAHATPVAFCAVKPITANIPWRVVLSHVRPYIEHNRKVLAEFNDTVNALVKEIDLDQEQIALYIHSQTESTGTYDLEEAMTLISDEIVSIALYQTTSKAEQFIQLANKLDDIRDQYLHE